MAVYRIELDGTLTRVIDDMQMPNGILISADNRTLYLVDNNLDPGGARTLLAYDIDDAGICKHRGVLHDYGSGYGGDGMVLDIAGNIYLTAGDGDSGGDLHLHTRLARSSALFQPPRSPATAPSAALICVRCTSQHRRRCTAFG